MTREQHQRIARDAAILAIANGPKTAAIIDEAGEAGTRRTLTQPLALQSTALRVALRSSGGNSVSYTMLFELLTLAIHLFKNTLAGQLGFAATLTEPNPRVFSE
jgi:hypothetical protein